MCDLFARRLLPCVLIRNKFSDLFFVVINGDARNRTEGNIGEKPLTCHRQNEAETSEKYNKYKGDVNERNRGRDLRPLFSILDTTILTDYHYSAHQDYFD